MGLERGTADSPFPDATIWARCREHRRCAQMVHTARQPMGAQAESGGTDMERHARLVAYAMGRSAPGQWLLSWRGRPGAMSMRVGNRWLSDED
jgi:hypothetical protein